MGGGPATIDIWDLKPGAPTGGPFQPISTTGDLQICEHMPLMAQQMKHMSIIRSMSTREADHNRGRYYMHTGFVPNPNVEHPGYGSVVAHQLADKPSHHDVVAGHVGPVGLPASCLPRICRSVLSDLSLDFADQRLFLL